MKILGCSLVGSGFQCVWMLRRRGGAWWHRCSR